MPRKLYASLFERLVANTREDEDGCWIWQGVKARGYPRVSLRKPGHKLPRLVAAHRLMLEIATGWEFPHDEAGHYVCFKPSCIRPDCLRVETSAENLSGRRGYADCAGSWIPVLYPTAERLLQAAADAAWEARGRPVKKCPF